MMHQGPWLMGQPAGCWSDKLLVTVMDEVRQRAQPGPGAPCPTSARYRDPDHGYSWTIGILNVDSGHIRPRRPAGQAWRHGMYVYWITGMTCAWSGMVGTIPR